MQTLDLPLGTPVPDSPHAVCTSLPTMADVIGYEEKRVETLQAMRLGYPRFFRHHWLAGLERSLAQERGLPAEQLLLACSERAAQALLEHVGVSGRVEACGEVVLVIAALESESRRKAEHFLQHTGFRPSSRQIEDLLIDRGELSARFEEEIDPVAPLDLIEGVLGEYVPGARRFHHARSGMSAFYGAFRAASELQAARGRKLWIQLGWLYLDTRCLLEKLLPEGGEFCFLPTVSDTEGLLAQIEAAGDSLAGLVTEVPTNPLIQTAAIEAICERVHAGGGLTILDPSLSSLANVDLLAHADIQVSSLTKYSASACDVMQGVAMVNPDSADAAALEEGLNRWIEPPARRDCERLAAEIRHWEPVACAINENVPKVVDFLEQHPAIERVYWAGQADSRAHYERLARSPGRWGAMVSFTLKGELADFYDAVPLVKGPSFGASFTLLCPFIYLAHYDLVSTPEGCAELRAAGLEPDLIRLSVGSEPAEEIIAALAQAL